VLFFKPHEAGCFNNHCKLHCKSVPSAAALSRYYTSIKPKALIIHHASVLELISLWDTGMFCQYMGFHMLPDITDKSAAGRA